MKKLLVISLLAIVGCSQPSNVDRQKTTYILKEYYSPLEIVIIDSCEYLYLVEGHSMVLTHKGNCKNCKTK